MVKVVMQEDCGNAPKQKFIRDFCVANANADITTVMNMVTEDIRLEIPGYATVSGKEEIQKLLQEDANRSKVTELLIANILTHGKRGVANGTLVFADGGVVAFCNMYTFNNHSKNAKLQLIQTYSIVLK